MLSDDRPSLRSILHWVGTVEGIYNSLHTYFQLPTGTDIWRRIQCFPHYNDRRQRAWDMFASNLYSMHDLCGGIFSMLLSDNPQPFFRLLKLRARNEKYLPLSILFLIPMIETCLADSVVWLHENGMDCIPYLYHVWPIVHTSWLELLNNISFFFISG